MLRDALGEAQAKGGTSGFLSLLLLPGRAAWRPPALLSPNPGGLALFWEGGSLHMQVLTRTRAERPGDGLWCSLTAKGATDGSWARPRAPRRPVLYNPSQPLCTLPCLSGAIKGFVSSWWLSLVISCPMSSARLGPAAGSASSGAQIQSSGKTEAAHSATLRPLRQPWRGQNQLWV